MISNEPVEAAGDVLVYHQRRDITSCICGWSELGRSHAAHQAELALEAAAPHMQQEAELMRWKLDALKEWADAMIDESYYPQYGRDVRTLLEVGSMDEAREIDAQVIPAGAVEELARELFIGDNANQPRETSIQDWRWFEVAHKAQGQVEHYRAMAAHVLAMGYGKVQK